MSSLRWYKLKCISYCDLRYIERDRDFLCKGASFFKLENEGVKSIKCIKTFYWLSVVRKPGGERKQEVVLNP